MYRRIRTFAAAIALILGGCAASISAAPTAIVDRSSVGTVALMPGGGVLADAVGVEIANRGFRVVDAQATTSLMARLNLNEFDVSMPAGLAQLKANGIDAVLIVRAVGGYDQRPESASARLQSTADGTLISGANWQNGRAGAQGSVADSMARVGLTGAARQIAGGLTRNIR